MFGHERCQFQTRTRRSECFGKKERLVEGGKVLLDNVAEDPTFIKRIITGDKTWIYEYDVELRSKNDPKPKKPLSR